MSAENVVLDPPAHVWTVLGMLPDGKRRFRCVRCRSILDLSPVDRPTEDDAKVAWSPCYPVIEVEAT